MNEDFYEDPDSMSDDDYDDDDLDYEEQEDNLIKKQNNRREARVIGASFLLNKRGEKDV